MINITFLGVAMASDIVQLLETFKSQHKSIKFLNTLSKDELRLILRQEIEPSKWRETAENARKVSIFLEEISCVIANAAKEKS
jgi:hypothetical protein